MEDEKALIELQEKLDNHRGFLRMVVAQQRAATLDLKRTQLTLEELGTLPDDAVTYQQVGKAYFLAPKQQLVEGLQGDAREAKDALSKLEQQAQHAAKAIQAADGEFRELIKQHQQSLMSKSAAV